MNDENRKRYEVEYKAFGAVWTASVRAGSEDDAKRAVEDMYDGPVAVRSVRVVANCQ